MRQSAISFFAGAHFILSYLWFSTFPVQNKRWIQFLFLMIGSTGNLSADHFIISQINVCKYEVCLRGNGTSVTKQFISSPNNNLHGFTFKVMPLKSNALFHPSLPHFYALLGGFFWNAPQFHHYSPLDGLHVFKTGPLDDPLELGEKKKVIWNKVRWIGRLFQHDDVLLSQELLDAQGIVSRCIVMVKQPQFVMPHPLSLLAHWAK